MGGVHLENVAGHQPVKEHAQRGQVLLDGGRGELSLLWRLTSQQTAAPQSEKEAPAEQEEQAAQDEQEDEAEA